MDIYIVYVSMHRCISGFTSKGREGKGEGKEEGKERDGREGDRRRKGRREGQKEGGAREKCES